MADNLIDATVPMETVGHRLDPVQSEASETSHEARGGVARNQRGIPSECLWAGELPLRFEDGQPVPLINGPNLVTFLHLKRAIDLVGGAVAMVLLLPLLLALAIAVKMSSPGPILFKQKRIGLVGRPFMILKFRTLRHDLRDEDGVVQAVLDDHRTTLIGRAMRRLSLDELPQLANVVAGDMSLVGPRPFVPKMQVAGNPYHEVVPYFAMRHQMKPGITGWAQVSGHRGPVDDIERARRRIDYDIAYIQNFSLLLDIKILLRTIARELRGGSGV